MNTRLLFVHAMSPLHAGTGQGIGAIDLPIAREKATGLPFLPGSSVKGTLKDHCPEPLKRKVFGPDTANADDSASSIQISDQRLLLLPVRSLRGTFAWVTSPYVLQRLVRDAKAAAITDPCFKSIPSLSMPANNNDRVACAVSPASKLADNNLVVLEDLDLERSPGELADQTSAWSAWIGKHIFGSEPEWKTMLTDRLCIVPDDLLGFLLNTATEITARIKLDENLKTVQKGALWYEEALPAETVLYGLVTASVIKDRQGQVLSSIQDSLKAVSDLAQRAMQFGGKATVGRGLCRLAISQ